MARTTLRRRAERAAEAIHVNAFAQVARPVILRYFVRRSCIASSRIAVECLSHFGLAVRPIPCRFMLFAPALKMAYVSGWTREEMAGRRAKASDIHQIEHGSTSWNGHVIVSTRNYLIDPSFDQAPDAFAARGAKITTKPTVGTFPLNGSPLPSPEFTYEASAMLDDETNIRVRYESLNDDSFLRAPAWELDHLKPAIREIVGRMKKRVR